MRLRVVAFLVFAAFAGAASALAAEPVHAGGDARAAYKVEIEGMLAQGRALLRAREDELRTQVSRLEALQAKLKDPKKKPKPAAKAPGGQGGEGKAASPMRPIEELSLIGYIVAGLNEDIRYLKHRNEYLEGLLAAL